MESRYYTEPQRHRANGLYQRDYARVMYSSAFRRLQGKMQLLGIQNDQFFRNRLTHSLEVAQISRSIAEMIQYDASELYVVECCALAHDLGNPPFGHAGEACLHDLFLDVGGFEGNAQTLRILTSIERKRPNFQGLNLTYRTLLGVTKYFCTFDPEKFRQDHAGQKFIYDADYALLSAWVQENQVQVRTLDVQIVDIADEIAYAAHDLEDGLRIKAYTIDEILHEYCAAYGDSDNFLKLKEIVAEARALSGYGTSIGSAQFSKLFRQELVSRIINLALNDIDLVPVTASMAEKTRTTQGKELGFVQYAELIHGLKKVVFRCVNRNDAVYHYENEGKTVLRFLAGFYLQDAKYLPPEYRVGELLRQYPDLAGCDQESLQKRLVCDYIAGMMDSYAISQYEKFSKNKIIGI
ncbi:deoxyguanosinetriphosphate triphosphohydrolase family protein [Acutalibacter caecimuris]|uniref:deoxyguanosinetriphosphate triphosphohydrolase family protein n=1 Tax=Acutalibacter caecimuris TaxID=3093657 RepID=UPI002AC924C3|nr:dNTP triphosphohydrolase [Acutalibacter sp. M00118]